MEMFETIPEAISICRETYPNRTYRVVDGMTGEYKEGTAYDIISWLFAEEFKERDSAPEPLGSDDVPCWALLEVIFTVEMTTKSGLRFTWERDALNLYNEIIAAAEDK